MKPHISTLFQWEYIPDPAPTSNAQVIIGMAFGANRKGSGEDSGESNKEIARIIYEMWSIKNVPVVVQREVSEALKALGIPIQPALVISERDNEYHIDSYHVLKQAWDYCEKQGLRTAIIVAHSKHILRCAWIAEKMGFTVKLGRSLSIPYEPGSRQWWTRNHFMFLFWEIGARVCMGLRGRL